MFSNLSLSSISLATVTPSLVMRGAPKLFSMTTLRPLGPSVTFTALARMSTPLRMRSRASRLNFTSLAAIFGSLSSPAKAGVQLKQLNPGARHSPGTVSCSADDAQDVAFLHDDEVFT